MPFDGLGFATPPLRDTGLFEIWSRTGWRLRLEAFRRRRKPIPTSPSERGLPADPALVVNLLREAKRLIEDPHDWRKGYYRSFGGGRCAIGALRAAARHLRDPRPAWAAHELLISVAKLRGFATVETMNDRSPHAVVIDAFDQAIELARAQLF
jgi:hypothetical protein